MEDQLKKFMGDFAKGCFIQKQAVREIDQLLNGKDAILKSGKYKGRMVNIKRACYHDTDILIDVRIYSIRPKQQFIDDHYEECQNISNLEFDLSKQSSIMGESKQQFTL